MPDLFEGSADVAVIGAPEKPADLAHHECLILHMPAFPPHEWTLDDPNGRELMEVDGPVHVNIAESLVVAIREGMGIGMVPLCAAISGLRDGTLVGVLPDYTLQKTTVYALYPPRKFIDAKTRTWVEFLRSHLPKIIARDEAFLAEVGQMGSVDSPMPVEACLGLWAATE